MTYQEEDFRQKYKIVCRVCGCDNCAISIEPGHVYDEHDSSDGSVGVTCPACGPKQDVELRIA